MKFKTAKELIDSYLNKIDFIDLGDVELPEYEWIRVKDYCFDNSSSKPELSAILANLYMYGLGVNADWVLAKSICETAVKKGSLNAIFTLGLMYYNGKVFYQSYENAIPYFEEAAAKGLWRAQFKLAICYSVPRGVKKDYQKAFDLFMKVAEKGYRQAQFNVAYYIHLSKVQYKNKNECVKWFELSANQGQSSAMYYLGEIYYYGDTNFEMALSWYNKSAADNNISALLKIAEFYENGIIVEQSYQKAYEYYMKTINLGNSDVKSKVREYQINHCHYCGAFFTKTVVKTLFGEKTICSACKQKY